MKALTSEEIVVLSNLLKEIKDKSLQTILRKVIFSNENVIDVIKEKRPETTKAEMDKLKEFLV